MNLQDITTVRESQKLWIKKAREAGLFTLYFENFNNT